MAHIRHTCTSLLIVPLLGAVGAGCFMTADESLWQRPSDVGRERPRQDAPPRDLHRLPDRRPVDLKPADLMPADRGNPDQGLVVVDIPVAEDASVKDGSPAVCFGGDTELAMGFCDGTENGTMRSWLKFQLASLPAGAQVISAEVRLFFFVHWSSQDYAIHRSATDTWSEASITWSTQPAADTVPLSFCPAFELDDVWKTWDVTAAVKQELAGDKVVSLMIRGVVTTTTDQENYARSKDQANPATRPVLRVTYSLP